MTDYFETALSSGFSAAILDPSGIESMGEYEFCQKRNPSVSTFAILKLSSWFSSKDRDPSCSRG